MCIRDRNIYLLAGSELEPDHPAEFPKWDRDRVLTNQEAFDVYLAPQAGRDLFYRFAVGANADSKYDAVSGLIADVMDPRHGRDDPTWNGEWQAESRLDAAAHRWDTLITIPFKTLGVDAPAKGVVWKANFGRYHLLPRGVIDRAVWSSAVQSTNMEDRSVFGEIEFE